MKTIEALKLATARRLAASGEARRIRQSAGLSLSEVAAVVGSSYVTIGRWERAMRRPTGRAALRYADLLAELRRLCDGA